MAYISFQPSDFFSTKIYTGTGSSNAITGVGFQPDTTWIKDRDASQPHVLFDAVRGANKRLYPNSTAAEGTETQALMSFDSDGFTLGTWGDLNNTDDFVSWNWKAGTTTGIDATGATITPTGYSFNQTSRFSIIAYTGNGSAGATIPHGLGVAPDLIITKELGSGGNDWGVFHSALGNTKAMWLNTTTAVGTSTSYWNDTSPTSVLFSVGTNTQSNGSGTDYVAYCFASKKGYSNFGSYTGNGSADGPFVYTGFRPAFFLVKDTAGTNNWTMFDNKRNPFWNPAAEALQTNSAAGEYNETEGIDFLSNGFKARESAAWLNSSGNAMIYIAFAEFPIVSSNSKSGTAR